MGGKESLDKYILETADTALIMEKFSDLNNLKIITQPWDLRQ